eukprot:gene13894-biopygen9125
MQLGAERRVLNAERRILNTELAQNVAERARSRRHCLLLPSFSPAFCVGLSSAIMARGVTAWAVEADRLRQQAAIEARVQQRQLASHARKHRQQDAASGDAVEDGQSAQGSSDGG